MNNNRKPGMMGAVFALALLAYNVIVFVIAGFCCHTPVFWMSWGFMLFGFGATALIAARLNSKGSVLGNWLFSYPIFKHTAIYLVADLVLSTVFMILEKTVSWQLAFILQFILLCLFLVVVFIGFYTMRTVEEVQEKVAVKTGTMRALRAEADLIVTLCGSNADLTAAFKKLAEDIHLSDPVSNEALVEIEFSLGETLTQCKNAIAAGDRAQALALCESATTILAMRNAKCKASK